MVKKVLAMLLAVCMMLTIVPIAAFAADEEDYKLFLNRDFEDGTPFDGLSVNSKSNIIKGDVEGGDASGNGFIRFQMAENKTEDCFMNKTMSEYTDNLMVEFDVSYDTDALAMLRLQYRDLNGADSYFMTVSSDGTIKCDGDDSEVGKVEKNKWTHVAFHIDFKKSETTFFVKNGKRESKVTASFKKPEVNTLSFFRFYVNGESNSSILIDNLKIYEGEEPREELRLEDRVILPKKIQNPVFSTPGEVGTRIFYNRTFEEGTPLGTGLSVNEKSNIVEIAAEENGNHYIKIETVDIESGSRDGYIDMPITDYTRFMVIEADFSVKNGIPGSQIFAYKNTAGKQIYMFNLKDGVLTYKGNAKPVGALEEGKWLKLALAIDWTNSSVDVYSNGERVYEGVPLPDVAIDNIGTLRIWFSSSAGKGGATLMVDNWRVYEGKEPREIKQGETSAPVSILPENDKAYLEEAKKLGDSAVMLNVDAGTMYAKGAKSKLDIGAYIKDGRTLVPVRAVSEAFGCQVGWDAETQTVSIDGTPTLVIGSNEMKLKDGSTYTLDVPAEITDGRTFIPLRALGEKLLGKYVKWDEHRLIVITDEPYSDSLVNYTNLNNFMLYDRPDAETLKSMFKYSGQHPRLLLNSVSAAELVERYNTNERVKKWGDAIINTATNKLNSALPVYETRDGLRFGNSYVNSYLPMAYMLTKDKKFADRAYEEIMTVAAFPDWNPNHYLDTSHQAQYVSLCYDWMYDAFTPEQRKNIEDALYKHAVKTIKDIVYGQSTIGGSFLKADTNWNVICATGMTMAAIALADVYTEDSFDVISKMIRAQEYMLPTFYPHGAWNEGPGYWSYLMQSLPYMYQSIEDNFGTDFNLTKAPGMEQTGYYLAATASAIGQNNFHDASVGTGMPSSAAMFWLAQKYNDPTLTSLRLYLMDKNKTGGGVMDMLFYDTNVTDTAGMSGAPDMYFGETEFVSLRNSWTNDDGAFVSFHGGETAVNHYHVDSGTFVIDMLGERWACDLGSENYNLPEMFGNLRTSYYRNRPEGHNVYVINPEDGGVGQNVQNTFAPIEKTVSSARGAYSIVNLIQPYSKYTTSARRGIKLEDDRRGVVVRDEFTPINANSNVYWFMHTEAEIEIVDNNTAILAQNGKKVKCMFETNGAEAVLSKMDAVGLEWSPAPHPDENDRSAFSKICLNFKATGDTYVQMKMVPYDDYLASVPMTNISLDNWTNEEGELAETPELSMIYADGRPIGGFNSSKGSYEIRVPYNVTAPYTITYDNPDGHEVILEAGAALSDTTKLTVKHKVNPNMIKTYDITYITVPQLVDVFSMTRHQVIENSASDVPEEANQPYNVSDNSTATRWACEGECWLQLDLGEVKNVDAIAISFMKGNERHYKFDVLVSTDGEIWTKALSNITTSGTTEEMELYKFDTTHQARYVRYSGYGSDANAWNSVTEFASLANK